MAALFSEALANLIKNAPEIAILAFVALRLEHTLRDCIKHNEEVIDKLLENRRR